MASKNSWLITKSKAFSQQKLAMEVAKLGLVFLVSVFTIIPRSWANIAEFDEFWKQREEAAWKVALAAYEPNPENITNHLNYNVNRALDHFRANQAIEFKDVIANSTRRTLRGGHKKYTGPCLAANPIDRCWRCKKKWAEDRKRLAKCVLGFGHKTRGGLDGEFYLVTDCSDDDVVNPKPGTLRHAVIQTEPLWIIFAKDMHIRLKQELIIQSHKTIDARGANVHIAYGCGLTLQFVENVIIHNLKIHHIVAGSGGMIRDSVDHFGIRSGADGDGISIFGSTNIWVDHISMSESSDGLIDVVQGSTAITISNCHFTHHSDVILLGASDTYSKDALMQVTVAFNHFGKELVQRMPTCRWGFFHVVNNDYTHWKMYAIGGLSHPTIVSQGNRFIAPDDNKAKEVTCRNFTPEPEWKDWDWRSEGDLFLNGAYFRPSGPPKPPKLKFEKKQMIKAKPGTFVRKFTRFAGSLDCKIGKKC